MATDTFLSELERTTIVRFVEGLGVALATAIDSSQMLGGRVSLHESKIIDTWRDLGNRFCDLINVFIKAN